MIRKNINAINKVTQEYESSCYWSNKAWYTVTRSSRLVKDNKKIKSRRRFDDKLGWWISLRINL